MAVCASTALPKADEFGQQTPASVRFAHGQLVSAKLLVIAIKMHTRDCM